LLLQELRILVQAIHLSQHLAQPISRLFHLLAELLVLLPICCCMSCRRCICSVWCCCRCWVGCCAPPTSGSASIPTVTIKAVLFIVLPPSTCAHTGLAFCMCETRAGCGVP
jgi:hypothetical protein